MSSSVLKWPDLTTVRQALERWAASIAPSRSDVVCIGYLGSYARGDWGVGSDLDLIIVVNRSSTPFELRPVEFDTLGLPVPADTLVYTKDEWQLVETGGQVGRRLSREVKWIVPAQPNEGAAS